MGTSNLPCAWSITTSRSALAFISRVPVRFNEMHEHFLGAQVVLGVNDHFIGAQGEVGFTVYHAAGVVYPVERRLA